MIRVGNKVRIINHMSSHGEIGEIINIGRHESPHLYDIKFSDGKVVKNWYKDEFELVMSLKEEYLVNGNVVETREGNKYLIIGNAMINLTGKTYTETSCYNDRLNMNRLNKFDIVKVYKITKGCAFEYISDYLELIWERETKPKYKLKKGIPDNLVVHTRDEQHANKLLEVLDEFGYKWSDGHKLTEFNRYEQYKEQTCYKLNNIKVQYAPYNFYYDIEYNTITYHQFMREYAEVV